MRMHFFKTLALGFTAAVILTTTSVFAAPKFRGNGSSKDSSRSDDQECLARKKIEQLTDRAKTDLEIVFSRLNDIYTFLGALSNPNPQTNPAISGIVASSRALINDAGEDFFLVLAQAGVPDDAIQILRSQSTDFIDFAIDYAVAVNLANTGQSGENQIAAAIAFTEAARIIGTSFFALTHDLQFINLLTDIANLSTQDVQAYRLVLEDGNAFGATPSDPASETKAAVVINGKIIQLIDLFAETLIPELAHEQCSGDL